MPVLAWDEDALIRLECSFGTSVRVDLKRSGSGCIFVRIARLLHCSDQRRLICSIEIQE